MPNLIAMASRNTDWPKKKDQGTDHLLISSEFSFFILYFFIFISSVHFFVYTLTRNRLGQFPSNFCQSSGPISSSSNLLKVMGSSCVIQAPFCKNQVIIIYLDNELSNINHIWYTSTSGQRSTKNVDKICTRTRASKFYNAPIRPIFCLHTFQAILSIFKICVRVSARTGISQYRITTFFQAL